MAPARGRWEQQGSKQQPNPTASRLRLPQRGVPPGQGALRLQGGWLHPYVWTASSASPNSLIAALFSPITAFSSANRLSCRASPQFPSQLRTQFNLP